MKIVTQSTIGVAVTAFISAVALSPTPLYAEFTDSALLRQNFESSEWNFDSLISVRDYKSGGVGYGHLLKVAYPPDDRGSPRITKKFDLTEQVNAATLSFDVKLHSKFEFVKGGKMHGLGGGTTTTGCKPVDPNGWSVRMMWRREGVPEVYVYHQDRVNNCGDGFKPDNFKFSKGKWYRIDLQVQMNSDTDSNNGKALLYIDGEKLVEANNLKLSGNANVEIDRFLFSTFYGGADPSWAPSKTTYVYYDNFTVRSGLKVTGGKGTECEIFLQGIYDPGNGGICCSNSCGSCGGSGCGNLPGGGSQCCTGSISSGDSLCQDSTDAPCKFA